MARDVIQHNHHHTTGIFGLRYLLSALADSGRTDLALAILRQTSYPSIGHLFSRGATTFWETWGEPEIDQRYGPRSLNHPMQAALDCFFFHSLAGINPDPLHPGFEHFFLTPRPNGSLSAVHATHLSPRGPISSHWTIRDGTFDWSVLIPPNSTATVTLPGSSTPMSLSSGRHHFTTPLP